ncbi:2-oxoglutarate dehydrogenase E1 component [Paenisporosarcina cavernae]|uniref:2-oxoglutarate dehydrogenase E1 component n=1 Tax=Paenisporosarcina cavernae TaxID=2320858 RepID=A0A385YSI0_9BACL|nr:2-oxoglutarate dehydrogenase E1 component [Paenisporosarcina cavernae]AYC29461.1 2-oxoglutarate dehydrogenase E1 component [Paenisporosarcina cavernae]
MTNNGTPNGSPWSNLSGPNLGYILEMYEEYRKDRQTVGEELASLFDQYGAPSIPMSKNSSHSMEGISAASIEKYLAAAKYADAIRTSGHLAADIYPLNDRQKDASKLEASYYGLTKEDLEALPASIVFDHAPQHVHNAWDATEMLKRTYTEKIAYEFAHVIEPEERKWLQHAIENSTFKESLSSDTKKELLKRLTQVEGFEKFLHRTFVGAKRFSVEGLDTLVVMLDELVRQSKNAETKEILIGMAHRGRLNVLTHVLNKPYEMMFADFAHVSNEPFLPKDGSLEITKGWFGDVKYHMGATHISDTGMKVKLAYNPSHLEVVSPVVTGQTRAAQETTTEKGLPKQNTKAAYSVLIHGDAAFPGQGIVTETLNYSRIRGFQTGGSVHIIANNMIGFTTEYYDSRSTYYSSDPAKGYEVPVVHVNADDVEAVISVAKFAFAYREKFQKDIVIDLIGYRRFGHNEMDEPLVTNPVMYHEVHKHDTVRALYGKQLVNENILSDEEVSAIESSVQTRMQEAYDKVKEESEASPDEIIIPDAVLNGYPEVPTGVAEETLTKMNKELLQWPNEFHVFKKLGKILKRREEPFKGKGKIDWAHAETLAFGTILQEGNPIRLTGQDAQRGTFAHRHLVLHDEQDGSELVPLHHISGANASFVVYNSPLTESAVLGYEFGYNLENEKALVIWEAQYGDFANMAQVMFDQFISASRSKWGQKSGLVMLLPHAYEGQGPEHSSARLERYLQMAAENNWTVANLSSASNYFHILRRQAKMLGEESIRPLIIVSPKSLLRHPLVGAEVSELTEGHFQTVIEHSTTGNQPKKVKKLLLASGKMAMDLADKVKDGKGYDHVHLVRVEQLYPFPAEKIAAIIEKFPQLSQVAWVQEEPKNMGSWTFAEPYLREITQDKEISYTGRVKRSSPAEGDGETHKVEQARIIEEAVSK